MSEENLVIQTVDGIPFRMKKEYDFSFLKKYGTVFKVFDDQDSGNICFGVNGENGKLFVKFAGATTARNVVTIPETVANLKATVPVYESLRHPALIEYLWSEEIGGGFAMIFKWAEGECMARMYPESHKRVMELPISKKIAFFRDIIGFIIAAAEAGFLAVDFYDGSVMYDIETGKTTVCDIDLFRRSPSLNDLGVMWGSPRFLSPEEKELGAVLDEVTNVFTIGQMGFALFTDSDRERSAWPMTDGTFNVLQKATSPDRKDRYQSLREFSESWEKAVEKTKI